MAAAIGWQKVSAVERHEEFQTPPSGLRGHNVLRSSVVSQRPCKTLCPSCSEEAACRFCFAELPDWRSAYNLPTATPVMSVWHNDVHHLLEVKAGVLGQAEFQQNIRDIFALGPHDIIELTFGCKEPGSGNTMLLCLC